MIGIIDYGMGNLYSVKKALERIGKPPFVSEKTDELQEATALILPGVGSFRDAMAELKKRNLAPFIKQWAKEGKPILGICLGMQLLFEESEENGFSEGLSLLPGVVRRFSGKTKEGRTYKVPHMGWNELTFHKKEHPVLTNVPNGHVYFVHSYVVEIKDGDVQIASANYGDVVVPAVVGRKNVWGTQFHPEKSSTLGMEMLKNFVR